MNRSVETFHETSLHIFHVPLSNEEIRRAKAQLQAGFQDFILH
jgi:hypothetical protein